MIDKTENAKNAFYKTEKYLFQKKEELFKSQNFLKWDLQQEDIKNYDRNLLIKDKELAFKLMCPKVFFF